MSKEEKYNPWSVFRASGSMQDTFARATHSAARPSARATIGYLVYKASGRGKGEEEAGKPPPTARGECSTAPGLSTRSRTFFKLMYNTSHSAAHLSMCTNYLR